MFSLYLNDLKTFRYSSWEFSVYLVVQLWWARAWWVVMALLHYISGFSICQSHRWEWQPHITAHSNQSKSITIELKDRNRESGSTSIHNEITSTFIKKYLLLWMQYQSYLFCLSVCFTEIVASFTPLLLGKRFMYLDFMLIVHNFQFLVFSFQLQIYEGLSPCYLIS